MKNNLGMITDQFKYIILIYLIISNFHSFGQKSESPVYVCPCDDGCSSLCSDLHFDKGGSCPRCGMGLQLLKINSTDILSIDKMKEDLDYVVGKLSENHVNPYLYISKVEFDRLYKKIRNQIKEPRTRIEFYLLVSELVTALKDGHTVMDIPMTYYNEYEKSGLVFPLSIMMSENGIFAKEIHHNNSGIKKGDQILAINRKSSKTIVNDFRMLINDVMPLYDVYAKLFTQLLWFKYGDSMEFQIEFKNQAGQIVKETIPGIMKSESKTGEFNSEPDFDFKVIDNATAVLTFSRMFRAEEFDHFLDSTFNVMHEKRIKNLIIDIRKNGGGRGRMADSLFSYLTEKPYNLFAGIKYKISKDLKDLYLSNDPNHTDPIDSAFIMSQPNGVVADFLKHTNQTMITITPHKKNNGYKGKVFLLTSNHTFSGGALVAGIFKCNAMGKIIGTAPSQTTKFVADHTYVKLPNSKLDLGISFVELHLPCEQSYYQGIKPDYEIKQKQEDIKNGIDTQMKFVIQLIMANK
jgi:C-terminal processing protease CtpA/Prc